MLDALSSFEERLKASRGMAFFHYGGHGVQVDGKNFLIPADADIPDEKRVATRAVELDEVMATLDAAGSSANIVVLDACRDNPLPATSSRSATRGLSVVQKKPKNSIIIYAAEAGSKAQDGLFTPELAKALTGPGRPISEVMTEVRREVYAMSGGIQTPGEYNQLFEQVSLSDGPAVGSSATSVTPHIASVDRPNGAASVLMPSGGEERALSDVKTYWNHNGSVMGLIPEGDNRTFIYVKPRQGMGNLVRPGMVFFTGKSDGSYYQGTARRFCEGMKPNLYTVSGQIKKGGNQVVLSGTVQTRNAEGAVTKTFEDVLIFELLPKYP